MNHSCEPNVVVKYGVAPVPAHWDEGSGAAEGGSGGSGAAEGGGVGGGGGGGRGVAGPAVAAHPLKVQVVALREIGPDEELFFSYIDTGKPNTATCLPRVWHRHAPNQPKLTSAHGHLPPAPPPLPLRRYRHRHRHHQSYRSRRGARRSEITASSARVRSAREGSERWACASSTVDNK